MRALRLLELKQNMTDVHCSWLPSILFLDFSSNRHFPQQWIEHVTPSEPLIISHVLPRVIDE